MSTAHIICSIKNLNQDYEHLQWLRMFFLNNGYSLSEDWIHHSLVIQNNKPRFRPAPNFDYMRVAMDSIHSSDIIVFLMSEPSTFTLTMLRYATYVGKPSIVISNSQKILDNINENERKYVKQLSVRNYQNKIRELI